MLLHGGFVRPVHPSTPARAQSHLPSGGPVLHLSSHLVQSNSFFPSFLFTSLCAPQSHIPNSPLLRTLGWSRATYPRKSSAHVQHG